MKTIRPKDQNKWCFFRNESCKKEGGFSHPQIASSKKVFYSYSTKRRDADIIKRGVEQILKGQGFELITFEIPSIPSTAYYCEKICSLVQESAFIVADISPADGIFFPNVIFEVGLAGGCGKPMVLITSVATHSTLEQLKGVWPTNLNGLFYRRDYPDTQESFRGD